MKNFKTKVTGLLFVIIAINSVAKAQCPTIEAEESSVIIVSFANSDHWNDVKTRYGLLNISELDIIKLNNQNHSTACNSIMNQKSMAAKAKYDLFFYKIQDKYFNVMLLKQPEEEERIRVGLSFLEIYDSNFNRLNGYSF
ncbi:MAG: hypothetical protein BalsKO_31280 [Balneolaceae bacterium]